MISVRNISGAVVAGALALASGAAWAGDSALAETLFHEGKKLFDQGNFAAACPKVAESQRLDPAGGTLLLLGLCHEREGKLASAWAELSDAVAQAKKDNRPDREKIAHDRVVVIEPKLSKLTVDVPSSVRAIAGLHIERNGEVLPDAAIGIAVPVDPGKAHIVASAPGYVTWSTDVPVGAAADQRSVTVPPLEKAVIAAPSASAEPPPPPPPPVATSSHTAAYVVGGVGVVALGVGSVFGVLALSEKNKANGVCPNKVCADPAARDASKSAVHDANIANVGIIVGAVGIGVAAVLFATAPSPKKESGISVSPSIGKRGGGFDFGLVF